MDLLQLLVGAVKVGSYLYSEHQAHKVEETPEFQEELKELELKLKDKDDFSIYEEFKGQYADDYGRGLITPDSHNGDVQFKAYMNVLKSRHFGKIYAQCDCGLKIGFLMLPPYDSDCDKKIERDYSLNSGICHCDRCGSRKKFKITGQSIRVEDF